MTSYHIMEKIKMIDYQISVRVRVNERHPKEWIVDALYDNLDRKNQEDIIEWYVTETNKKEAKDQEN